MQETLSTFFTSTQSLMLRQVSIFSVLVVSMSGSLRLSTRVLAPSSSSQLSRDQAFGRKSICLMISTSQWRNEAALDVASDITMENFSQHYLIHT